MAELNGKGVVGEVTLGTLMAVPKQFKDATTGEVRSYYGYQVKFKNGAVVRFAPLQDDRALLRFVMQGAE